MRRRPNYDWLEHTADIMVRIRGRDEGDLYASAALTLTDVMVEYPVDEATEPVRLTVRGPSPEARLVEVLRELIYRFDVDGVLWVEARGRLDGEKLVLRGRGVTFDPSRHTGLREVKAVTYHQLAVRREENEWSADVVFDV
jgi:SHS2 domain-containing protein